MEAAQANTGEDFNDYRDTSSVEHLNRKQGTSVEPDRNQTGQPPELAVENQRTTINTSGSFDDFFKSDQIESTGEPINNQTGTRLEVVLTLKEAVEFYKISEKTIRLHIAQGKIPARKEPGPKGLEWRIYPSGIPQKIEEVESISEVEIHDDQTGTEVELDWNDTGTTEEPDWNQVGSSTEPDRNQTSEPFRRAIETSNEIERMLAVIQKQAEKLESANYRIGYLEAQTQNYQEQVRLLTDRQRTPGLWSRFYRWFLGKS